MSGRNRDGNHLKDGKRAPLSPISKVIIYLLLVAAAYYSTEFFVDLAHKFIFNQDEYLSFRSQSEHVKYFVVGVILALTGFKFLSLNNKWRFIFSLFLLGSVIGIAWFGTAFQGANEDGVIKNRLVYAERYGWDEVRYVETDVFQKKQPAGRVGNRRAKKRISPEKRRIEVYNAHVNGKDIKLWEDLDSMYELTKVLSDKQVRFNHKEDPTQFDIRFTSFYKDDLYKAHLVFGISDGKEVKEK